MSQPLVELSPDSMQARMYGLQYGMVPLLESLDRGDSHINRADAEIFSYQNEIGRLSVRHAMELLHVRLSDQLVSTGEADKPFRYDEAAESLGFRASYQLAPDGAIVPSPLYTGLNFAVRMRDEGHWYIGRYVPKYLHDDGGILESDVEGPLSPEGLRRLENFVDAVAGPALAATAKPTGEHLQLVQP